MCDPAATAPGDDSFAFRKVHDEPVTSLGLGHGGRAAVLNGNTARLFDGKRWVTLEPALPSGTLQIFFGRDNEPRVMGFSPRESGEPAQVYLRCRNHRCQPAPDEIGRLGGARGALYGVLGFDDPEVVCRVGQICLVKRLSGWKSITAHAQPARVLLSAGTAFALHSDRVERVNDAGFVALEPARSFHEPRGVALQPNGVIWVIDEAGTKLARLESGKWQDEPSPLRSARALWARANDDLWLVGENGAARFDGKRWSCVAAAPGPLEFVLGNDDQVWLAGQSGTFRGERVRSLRNHD